MQRPLVALVLLMALAGTVAGWTPQQAVAAAEADVRKFPTAVRPYLRYLDIGEMPLVGQEGAYPVPSRSDVYRVLCGHVHHLSRSPNIERLGVVPGTNGGLLRLNYEDYDWELKTWESLAEADPYYHTKLVVVTQTPWQGGIWPGDGKLYAAGSFRTEKRTIKTSLAPWLGNPALVASLAKETQSQVPIVRGVWFFWQTAAQQNRKPGYYDFLRVVDRKSFQELGGFDAKIAEKFGNDIRASVSRSGVTLQPRALVRRATLGGGYWQSLDFKLAIGEQNPLRVLGKDIEKAFIASEEYIHLPSGFWATGLFDKEGKAQEVAPNFIAGDGKTRSNDYQVHANVGCVRCHVNGGLRDIADFQRNLFQPPLGLTNGEYKDTQRLRREYFRHLEPFLDRDRAVYAAAVLEATGWTPQIYAAKYSALWEATEDAAVDLKWAARDLGVAAQELEHVLQAQVLAGVADPVLSSLLLKGPRQQAIGIRQWVEVLPIAMTLIHGSKK